jgi:hypothetical protein
MRKKRKMKQTQYFVSTPYDFIGTQWLALLLFTVCLSIGCGDNSQSAENDADSGDTSSQDTNTDTGTNTDIELEIPYAIVDTNVLAFYDTRGEISAPQEDGAAFYGQDAHYVASQPDYTDNNDGTITDNVTGLMWQKDMGEMVTFDEAVSNTSSITTGGYNDWRLPTIKELFSLILYSGQCMGPDAITPFIDTTYFDQPLGDTSNGGREIDAQTWSSTEYLGITMRNDSAVFGVNFIDGRVKGYPKQKGGSGEYLQKYARYVRANSAYGENDFVDNDDQSVSDNATSLMWQQSDDGQARDWEEALAYCQDLTLAGFSDWHLPDAKELQSIVDYTRSPQTEGGNSAAIDPVFHISQIEDPEGENFYPYFWTSTTLLDGVSPGNAAVYVTFGRALGYLTTGGNETLLDVHGAGAIRSDPKTGNASDYPSHTTGFQGDVQYVYNFVRCVRVEGITE